MFHQLTLTRTGCFGDCPVYHVEVRSDGMVKWHGEFFVAQIGECEWKLDDDQMKRLLALMDGFDFFNYEYEANGFPATDLPSCITSITYEDGAVKEVDHYLGDSLNEEERLMTLEEFEEEIDRIVGTHAYI
ncbi:DUF6438 domain-containing protein [Halobacillus sp. A5]|uniref:DUF6438 domain-containing protein n=1 Tax=Halobacillus sp. A5 TaxID=2880263 RepID=UPI0020A69C78|nr:DUF6438 domain-containing protein [Halobacillus sp. A5]MCP3027048.1 DUF6438 domain-containing protein [Halobacillus sp. A5]